MLSILCDSEEPSPVAFNSISENYRSAIYHLIKYLQDVDEWKAISGDNIRVNILKN